jgi:type I restriction enzyme S subunit
MGSEWQETTVGERFELANGFAFKSKDFVDEGIPVIKIKNVKAGYFSDHTFSYVSPEFIDKRKDKLARVDDLLISMSGNRHDGSPETWVGKIARFDRSGDYFINQRVGALRPKDASIIDPRFASYLLSSWEYQQLFISIATSSGGQANLSPGQILGAPFVHPPLPEQKAIAHILGSLDDKIELNRRMNATLEGMAQALFKSWFIDFDPVIDNILVKNMSRNQPSPNLSQGERTTASAPGSSPNGRSGDEGSIFDGIPYELTDRAEVRRQALADGTANREVAKHFPANFQQTESMGWIPEGWKVSKLEVLAKPKKGKNITKKTIIEGDVPVVAGGLKPAYFHNTPNVNGPVITISASGANAGFVNLYHQDIWVSDCSYVSSNDTDFIYSTFLFLKSRQERITHMQQGAAQPHVYPKDLLRLLLANPAPTIWQDMEKTIKPSFHRMFKNEKENQTLTKLRDTLLPKLISGELSIPGADQLTEEALV